MSIKEIDKINLDEYKNNLELIIKKGAAISQLKVNVSSIEGILPYARTNKEKEKGEKLIAENKNAIENYNKEISRHKERNEIIKNIRNDAEWEKKLTDIENEVNSSYARKPTNNKKSKIRSAQNNSRRKSLFKILRSKKIISAIFRSNNSKKREVSDEQLIEEQKKDLGQAKSSIEESKTFEEALSRKIGNIYNIDDDETLIEEEYHEIVENNKETKKEKDITLELANRLLSNPDTNMSETEEAQNDKITSERIESEHVGGDDDFSYTLKAKDYKEIEGFESDRLNKKEKLGPPELPERSSNLGETQINENVMEKAVITDDEWTAKDINNLVEAVEWISMVNNHGGENNQNEIETSTNISNDVQANIDTNLNDKPEMEQISNESQVIVGEKTNNNQQKAKPMVDKPQSVNEQEMPVDNRNFRIGNNNFVIPSDFEVEYSLDRETGVETRTIKNGEQIIGSVASIDNQVISAHFNSVKINMDIGGKTRALSSESELTLNYDFGEKKMTYEATDKDFPEQSFKMDFSDNEIIKPRMEENMTLDTSGYDSGTYGESSYACNSYIEKQKSAYRSNAKAYSR
ncbi:MAG: hypothetical protein K6D38_09745 [Pseudobutyrivibrio sp.]|nr:hypothetical protein [Pseudobutyrivibrio sp.]